MKHLKEIVNHAIGGLNDKVQEGQDKGDLHHVLFNEDYFVVGYHAASELLKAMNIGEFEAIAYVMEQEREMFGEVNLKSEDMNSEKITNLFAYFKGEELLHNLKALNECSEKLTDENIQTLIAELEEML